MIASSTSHSSQTGTGSSNPPPTGSNGHSSSQTAAPPNSGRVSVIVDETTVTSDGKTIVEKETHTTTYPPSSNTAPAKTSASPTFAASLPAGAVTLISPPVISGPQYYKVGDNVTFVFGYTNVLATPSAVDVLAIEGQETWTMAQNHKVANETGTVVWDSSKTGAAQPLFNAMYTLAIYDAGSSITDSPKPGYLAPFEQYQFGMYIPQSPVPLPAFQCATCNSAGLSEMERMALTTVFGMGIITILSFTWFVGGLAIAW